MPETQTPDHTIASHIARIRAIESRGWPIVVLAAIVGVSVIASTADEIGRLAVYNAGLCCCIGALISAWNLVQLSYRRDLFALMADHRAHYDEQFEQVTELDVRTLNGIGSMLGVAEDDLGQRRGRG